MKYYSRLSNINLWLLFISLLLHVAALTTINFVPNRLRFSNQIRESNDLPIEIFQKRIALPHNTPTIKQTTAQHSDSPASLSALGVRVQPIAMTGAGSTTKTGTRKNAFQFAESMTAEAESAIYPFIDALWKKIDTSMGYQEWDRAVHDSANEGRF